MQLTHIEHNNIDLQKWNTCIKNACNSLVYAESWYLDIVSPSWEALILGDYEYVMPLPVKRKFGIPFLVQPPLTQQLGVFSKNIIEDNMIEQFIKEIPYRSYHLNFNEQNPLRKGALQPNFVLNLNKDEQTIISKYSTNTKRNIKKARQSNIEIKTDLSAKEFLTFYCSTKKNYPVDPEAKVKKLIEESFKREKATLYGAYNVKNELVSTLCLLHSPQRLIYLLPVSNEEGKERLAMFGMVDKIIQDYLNSNFLLDFYGSNVKSIARFYESFGAEINYYYTIKHWSINDWITRFCFWK